jgi:hypothetical protein
MDQAPLYRTYMIGTGLSQINAAQNFRGLLVIGTRYCASKARRKTLTQVKSECDFKSRFRKLSLEGNA